MNGSRDDWFKSDVRLQWLSASNYWSYPLYTSDHRRRVERRRTDSVAARCHAWVRKLSAKCRLAPAVKDTGQESAGDLTFYSNFHRFSKICEQCLHCKLFQLLGDFVPRPPTWASPLDRTGRVPSPRPLNYSLPLPNENSWCRLHWLEDNSVFDLQPCSRFSAEACMGCARRSSHAYIGLHETAADSWFCSSAQTSAVETRTGSKCILKVRLQCSVWLYALQQPTTYGESPALR